MLWRGRLAPIAASHQAGVLRCGLSRSAVLGESHTNIASDHSSSARKRMYWQQLWMLGGYFPLNFRAKTQHIRNSRAAALQFCTALTDLNLTSVSLGSHGAGVRASKRLICSDFRLIRANFSGTLCNSAVAQHAEAAAPHLQPLASIGCQADRFRAAQASAHGETVFVVQFSWRGGGRGAGEEFDTC